MVYGNRLKAHVTGENDHVIITAPNVCVDRPAGWVEVNTGRTPGPTVGGCHYMGKPPMVFAQTTFLNDGTMGFSAGLSEMTRDVLVVLSVSKQNIR